ACRECKAAGIPVSIDLRIDLAEERDVERKVSYKTPRHVDFPTIVNVASSWEGPDPEPVRSGEIRGGPLKRLTTINATRTVRRKHDGGWRGSRIHEHDI